MARARAAAKPSVPKATTAAKPSVPKATTAAKPSASKATTAAKPSVSKESPKIISHITPVPNKKANGDKKKETAVPYTNKTLQDSRFKSNFPSKQEVDAAYKKHMANDFDGLDLEARKKLLKQKQEAFATQDKLDKEKRNAIIIQEREEERNYIKTHH
jgi:hypothetical protein